VNAADVLALAKKIYSTHQLSAVDAHTVRCSVPEGGFTYVPVPAGTGANFAGLFTVDLPSGVQTGQVFTIVIRTIATRRLDVRPRTLQSQAPISISSAKVMRNWRYVVGSFAVRIPVTTAQVMLPLEANTLAIMKWRLGLLSPRTRWYPVLRRYISYIAARVDGLGGNSGSIQPSPWGVPTSTGIPCEGLREFTGKVCEVTFDCFGDFTGFALETCARRYHFNVCERNIGDLALRASKERLTVSVVVEHSSEHTHKIRKLIVRC
jgi:hypothetical protein